MDLKRLFKALIQASKLEGELQHYTFLLKAKKHLKGGWGERTTIPRSIANDIIKLKTMMKHKTITV